MFESTLQSIARDIAASSVNDVVVNWLRTVPGLPPIVQTIHIVAIGIVMASIVMIDLRVLGWAARRQQLAEMTSRLMPWLWTALPLLFLSGAMFVIARPRRYFASPVFGIKLLLLVLALAASMWLIRLLAQHRANGAGAKGLAVLSLTAWLGVVLAGRWIAYADYLFPPE